MVHRGYVLVPFYIALNTMPWGLIGKRRIKVVSVPNFREFSKRFSPAAILKCF